MAETKARHASADFGFGEPVAQTRAGRASWMDDAEQTEPIDKLIDSFVAAFGKNGAGYARSVGNFSYAPLLDVPEDKRSTRISQRVNQRAEKREIEVHSRSIRGVLHLVTGPRVVVKRAPRKNGNGHSENGSGEDSE